MHNLSQIKQFIEPKSVALIGISRDTGENSFNILENLLSYGYKGKIYPVNPNASEILGVKTYSSVSEITESIDLAVISTPRALVPRLVKECTQQGIRAITIVGQGFNDASDSQGKQLQKEIDNTIRTSQTRVLGPNTFGAANAYANFSSSFVRVTLRENAIGLVCQSGFFFPGFPELSLTGKSIDVGNSCDIGVVDGLQYLEHDADTKVIALHIEGTKDPRGFLDAARHTAAKKPLLVLKTGKSQQAARAAQSHTGAMVGSHEIWSAALKQAGIIQTGDLEELIDLTRAFSALPSMKNPKVGVATISGGLGILTIDGCQSYKIEVGKLSQETQKHLEAVFPQWLKAGNPVDYWPTVMSALSYEKSLIDILETLLSDRQLGGFIFIMSAFDRKSSIELYELLNELATAHPDKPLAPCIYGPWGTETIKMLQDTGKVAAFPTPERATRALARLYEYSRLRSRL